MIADAPAADPGVMALDLPVLGSATGYSSWCIIWAARWRARHSGSMGMLKCPWCVRRPLFQGLPGTMDVWMSHGDHASQLPEGFELTAETSNAVAGIANEARRMWAVQFHPEVAHTRHGMALLRNFALDICGCKQDWTAGALHPVNR